MAPRFVTYYVIIQRITTRQLLAMLHCVMKSVYLTPAKHFYDRKKCNVFLFYSRASVGIAVGYGLDSQGIEVRFSVREKDLLFSTASTLALKPTQPLIQCVPGTHSPGIKRPGRESDHSPPSSTERNVMLYFHSTIHIRRVGRTAPFALPYPRTLW
jgi:hypothetical protein